MACSSALVLARSFAVFSRLPTFSRFFCRDLIAATRFLSRNNLRLASSSPSSPPSTVASRGLDFLPFPRIVFEGVVFFVEAGSALGVGIDEWEEAGEECEEGT